ncbi:MAG: hypothetical protein R2750_09620 [Bacteroidales bacterium]
MKSSEIHKALIIILIVFVSLQAVQFVANVIPINPLHGVTVQNSIEEFNSKTWLDQSFQDELSGYIDFNFGFRPLYIRLYNQMQYSFFKQTNANNIYVGKQSYLYEGSYIASYYGKNFIGKQTIDINIKKLEEILQFLNTMNTELLILIAPSKAYYYPDYFPDELVTKKEINNYEYYLEVLPRSTIPFVDFNRWFVQQKQSTPYPLMTKNGIHWSEYGSVLAADSILKTVGFLLGKNMAGLSWDGVEYCNKPSSTDYDLERLLNLIFPLPGRDYAYPQNLAIKADSTSFKPSVLFIGDSFFWNINFPAFKSAFKSVQFWYYNRLVDPASNQPGLEVNELTMISALEKNDIIILLSSTPNLQNLGYGFIDNVYNFINKDFTEKRAGLIQFFKTSILEAPDWLETIKQKAVERNISMDSMITIDATFLADIEMREYKQTRSE